MIIVSDRVSELAELLSVRPSVHSYQAIPSSGQGSNCPRKSRTQKGRKTPVPRQTAHPHARSTFKRPKKTQLALSARTHRSLTLSLVAASLSLGEDKRARDRQQGRSERGGRTQERKEEGKKRNPAGKHTRKEKAKKAQGEEEED